MKELYLIINEKVSKKKINYFCENKDIQSIVNFLSVKYNLFIISRSSAFAKPFKLNGFKKILYLKYTRILNFIFFLFKIKKKIKILIISITPFNFIIFLVFKVFYDCKSFLYLRSNGFEEYENILGKKYIWIYNFMFKWMTKYSEVIVCHKRLYNKKCHILYPSELSNNWKKKIIKNNYNHNKINLLYVGRFKIEKGIFFLLKIFDKLPDNVRLTIVGSGDLIEFNNSRIKCLNFIKNEKKLISIYDSSNILILPSYTEAHPKVIDEAMSRMRPVIIFNDIKYVAKNRFGVFPIKRSVFKLIKTINHIKKNNEVICSQLKKNVLPIRKNFLEDLNKIIN